MNTQENQPTQDSGEGETIEVAKVQTPLNDVPESGASKNSSRENSMPKSEAQESAKAESNSDSAAPSSSKRAEQMLTSLNAAVASKISALKEDISARNAKRKENASNAVNAAENSENNDTEGLLSSSRTSHTGAAYSSRSRSNTAKDTEIKTTTANTSVTSANSDLAGSARSVKLTLMRIEPWSVMKFSFLIAVALGVASLIAAALLWSIVDSIGLWDQITAIGTSLNNDQPMPFMEYFEFSKMMSYVVVVSVVNVIVITAMGTLLAFLYNIVAALLGGIRFTFTDR